MQMEQKMVEAPIWCTFPKMSALNFVKKIPTLMDVHSWFLMAYALLTVVILLEEMETGNTSATIEKVNDYNDVNDFEWIIVYTF